MCFERTLGDRYPKGKFIEAIMPERFYKSGKMPAILS